jgi:hypothetical protein
MSGRALAHRLPVLNGTGLKVTAGHDCTGVDAGLFAADVDAAEGVGRTIGLALAGGLPAAALPRIERVAGEAVQADAGTVVVVCHTARVGPALDVAAGVNAPKYNT